MNRRQSCRVGWVTVAVFVVCLFGTSFARAADPGEVEDLLRQAIALRREGKDNLALPMLAKAYSLAPIPRTAAQLGLVEMALGYQLDAERHLTEGLASPRDLWIQKYRDTLEQSLRRVEAAIGEIVVQGSPKGAEVSVNGKPVGQLPLSAPVRVGEGPSIVAVRASGYVAETHSVKVMGTKREQIAVHLQSAEVAATSPPPAPLTQDRTGRSDENHGRPADEPESSVSSDASPSPAQGVDLGNGANALRSVAWVTAAAAVAGVGLGVFETLRWRDKRDQFDRATTSSATDPMNIVPACGTDEPNRGSLRICQTLYADMNQAKTLAIVAFAVGGGLAIGSAVLFVSSQRSGGPAKAPAIACAPAGSFTSVACRMIF